MGYCQLSWLHQVLIFSERLVKREMTCSSVQVHGPPKSCLWTSWQWPSHPALHEPGSPLWWVTPSSPVTSCTDRLFVLQIPQTCFQPELLQLLFPWPGMLFPSNFPGAFRSLFRYPSYRSLPKQPLERNQTLPVVAVY